MNNTSTSSTVTSKPVGLFFIFLVCGLAVFMFTFAFSMLLSFTINLIVRICLVIIFLLLTIRYYKSESQKQYGQIFFSLFAAASGLLISWLLSDQILQICNLNTNNPTGLAIAKLSESALIVISILILNKIAGNTLASVYLKIS